MSGAITTSRDTHQLPGATSALLHYHLVVGGNVGGAAAQSELRYCNDYYRTHALLHYYLVVGGKVVGATAQSGLRYCNDYHHTRALLHYHLVVGGKVVGAAAQSGLRYCNDHHTHAVPARQKFGIWYKVVLGGGCRVGIRIGIGAGRKSQSKVARW